MKINSCKPINFTYKHILKTLYFTNDLPIKKGFYGDVLTKDTVSLEHIKPHSKGGETILSNLVLASKKQNEARGNLPLASFFNPKKAKEYLDQFTNLIIPYNFNGKRQIFDGNKYIQAINETIKKELKI